MTDNETCQMNIICYTPWKYSNTRTNVIPSNSRPIPQPRRWHAPARPMPSCSDGVCGDNNISIGVPPIDHNDYVSGAGFIARRTIQNASKNAQGIWYRAAPNPIKHWRKQLFPRQGDLPGSFWNVPSERISIRQLMETPGGTVTLDNKYNGILWQSCNNTMLENTLSTPLYLNEDPTKSSCEILGNESIIGTCSQKIKRRNTIYAKGYHSSTKAYLQSRVRLYKQRKAIQFSRRKNIIAQSSKPNMFESLYKTDVSGCFVPMDCSCVVQVAYKPRNIGFATDSAVSSSLYTKKRKSETITQNQYNITNRWGLDGINTFKIYPLTFTSMIRGRGGKNRCCPDNIGRYFDYFTSDWSYMWAGGIINPTAPMYEFFVFYGLAEYPVTQWLVDYMQPLSHRATNMQGMLQNASSFNFEFVTQSGGPVVAGKPWEVDNVTNMSYMFDGASSFNNTTIGGWDTGNVENMSYMFRNCTSFNTGSDITGWNTTKVTNMAGMFYNCSAFNQDISTNAGAWVTSSVENMSYMFYNCSVFDQDIGNWVTSSVENMSYMFYNCSIFNQDIGNWVTSAVTDMRYMFYNCSAFNQDIGTNAGAWVTSSVENMSYMFYSASFFNQDIGNWVTSAVTDMRGMFGLCFVFDKDISSWNVSSVTDMGGMFEICVAFDANLSSWIVDEVLDFNKMFYAAQAFNQDISSWNVDKATDMGSMFESAIIFNANISIWDVDNVTNMDRMFKDAQAFNQDLSSWNVAKVTNMSQMFYNVPLFNQDISSWDVGNVTNMGGMFFNATAFDQNISGWNLSSISLVTPTFALLGPMAEMFSGAFKDGTGVPPSNGNWVGLSNFRTKLNEFIVATGEAVPNFYSNGDDYTVTSTSEYPKINNNSFDARTLSNNWGKLFLSNEPNPAADDPNNYADLSNAGITNLNQLIPFNGSWTIKSATVTDMNFMFEDCTDLSGTTFGTTYVFEWDPVVCRNMEGMFRTCTNYNEDLSNWNVANVTSMQSMFRGATIFDQDIGNWNVAKVTHMGSIFQSAINFDQDIGSWNVANVETMISMFYGATSFNNGGSSLNSWNVAKVTDMGFMFRVAPNFNQNISSWNVAKVETMRLMFDGASSFNQDIGNWNVAKVEYMQNMFANATNFDQNLSSWTLTNIANMNTMFWGAFATTQTNGDWSSGSSNFRTGINTIAPVTGFFSDGSTYIVGSNSEYPRINNTLDPSTLSNNWGKLFNANAPNPTPDDPANFTVLNNAGITNITQLLPFNSDWTTKSASVTDMNGMFIDCTSLDDTNGISTWDTALVADMSGMFYGATNFNEDISSWDTTLVTDMSGMFYGATAFDQDIGNWDISMVTDVTDMFTGTAMATTYNINSSRTVAGWVSAKNGGVGGVPATIFGAVTGWPGSLYVYDYVFLSLGIFQTAGQNYPASPASDPTYGLADDWCVSRLTDMEYGFENNGTFNQDISNWDTANVTNMFGMFKDATVFNQNISNWDMSNNKNMGDMFWEASNFNQDIGGWNVINVTNMQNMFKATPFDQDISGWNVSNVTVMFNMFSSATAFNQDIGGWNTINVTTMNQMFYGGLFNKDIGGWDVSNVEFMAEMFRNTSAFDQDISGWNVSNVVNMANMFTDADVFNQDIGGWDVGNVTNMTSMFSNATAFDQDISGWNLSSISSSANMTNMFNGAFGTSVNGLWVGPSSFRTRLDALATISDITSFFSDGSDYTVGSTGEYPRLNFGADLLSNNWGKLFLGNMPNSGADDTNNFDILDNAGITDLNQLLPFDITWTTKSALVTDMNNMFKGCTDLSNTTGIVSWDPSGVTDMSGMFWGATNFDEDIGGWDVGNVTDMEFMFYGASSFNQDISGWNISSVTNMRVMFSATTAFNNGGVALSNWNTVNVTSMLQMFKDATAFNQDISGWNVSSVNNMEFMFNGASAFDQDISGWNVSSVTDMDSMFNGAFDTSTNGLWIGASNFRARLDVLAAATISGEIPSFFSDGSNYSVGSTGQFPQLNFGANALSNNWGKLFLNNAPNPSADDTNNYDLLTADGITDLNQLLPFDITWTTKSENVTDMNNMFKECTDLSGTTGITSWNTELVRDMSGMFYKATYFNENIDVWDVTNVTDMEYMFREDNSFNQDLNSWNTSNVLNMDSMFRSPLGGGASFNGDLSFNTINVASMRSMFRNSDIFNRDLRFNTSNVTSMSQMFAGTTAFNQDLTWNTINVTSMSNMFNVATAFNQDLSWNTSNVETMAGMFSYASAFNQDISRWDVANVESMFRMFEGATAFNQDIGNWDVSMVTNVTTMFGGTPMATTYNINSSRTVAGWVSAKNGGASGVPATIFSAVTGWPGGLYAYSYVFVWGSVPNLSTAGQGYVSPIDPTYGDAADWNVSRWRNGGLAFGGNTAFNRDIGNWDVTNISTMNAMFEGASAFDQDLNNWDMTNVTDIVSMFKGCSAFNGNITSWNLSRHNGNLGYTFQNCSSFNQDIGGWDISKCWNIQNCFEGATIFDQDISGWRFDTPSLTTSSFNRNFFGANMSSQDWSGSGAGGTAWRAALNSVTPGFIPISQFFTTGANYNPISSPGGATDFPIINPP